MREMQLRTREDRTLSFKLHLPQDGLGEGIRFNPGSLFGAMGY